jgi:diaminopimelate decarboxylase
VTVLLDTVARVHRELGIAFEFINIGGGLGIPYRPAQATVNVEELAATLRRVVDERLAAHKLPFTPRLSMENGRYMTGPFGYLLARCEVVKRTFATYYGLDACMSNLMRPGVRGARRVGGGWVGGQ